MILQGLKNMEFDLLMADIPINVSYKFEMYIFKIALIIKEPNARCKNQLSRQYSPRAFPPLVYCTSSPNTALKLIVVQAFTLQSLERYKMFLQLLYLISQLMRYNCQSDCLAY